MLTQEHFESYKDDYTVYRKTAVKGAYGETITTKTRTGTIHVMWHPVTDEAAVAEYGERVTRMLEAVLYEGSISELDIVGINGADYEVCSILPYNTHRLVRVEKVETTPTGATGATGGAP